MSNANLRETGYMLNQRAKYTARYGVVVISTANPNLNGSGTTGVVITAASNGTLIKRIIIKAQTNTTDGMVRLYVVNPNLDPAVVRLLIEVEIPAVPKSSNSHSYSIEFDFDFYLVNSYQIWASTENAETFNVIAEGLDITYPP